MTAAMDSAALDAVRRTEAYISEELNVRSVNVALVSEARCHATRCRHACPHLH